MTKEEFRDYVDFLRSQDEISYDVYSGLIDGIDTLEQQPCEDAISREDALMALTGKWTLTEEWTELTDKLIHRFIKRIKALPSVNSQSKIGHWILTSDDDYEYCTCSECGYQNGENWMIGSQIKFCQECGAKMQKVEE